VDTEGRLVGINTAILSRSGGYQGIGFAIPTKMAGPIMESLKKYGKVTRGWLGVSIQDVDQELSSTMKLPIARGVLIADVQNGSPASRSGLRRGDVIVKVEGQPVASSGEFRNAIASAGANRNVSLELYRDSKPMTLSAALGESPSDAAPARPQPGEKTRAPEVDGLTLSDLGPETRRAFGIADSVDKGAVITNVTPGGPAARAGLRPGDVLLEVNRKPVASAREFGDAYVKAKGNVLLLVHRRGATVFLVLKR
jgi:serine protease Do